jgi:hypothetical protein
MENGQVGDVGVSVGLAFEREQGLVITQHLQYSDNTVQGFLKNIEYVIWYLAKVNVFVYPSFGHVKFIEESRNI